MGYRKVKSGRYPYLIISDWRDVNASPHHPVDIKASCKKSYWKMEGK